MFSCKYCEISKKTYFEEHLRTPSSEETLEVIDLDFISGESLSKPTWTLQKYQSLSNQNPLLNLNPYALFWTQDSYAHH